MLELTLLVALSAFASFMGTVVGFGSSTIMVPILLIFYPLPESLLFAGVIHLCNDLWKVLFFKKDINWRLILGFGIPGIFASFVGASMSLSVPEELVSRVIGLLLLFYVGFVFFKPTWKLPANLSEMALGGTLSGFFAGIFGVGGPIRTTFLNAFDLPTAAYLFTSGAIAFVIDASRLATYLFNGVSFKAISFYALLLSIPVSFLFALVAKRVVKHISHHAFRVAVATFLGIVAVKFLLFP